MGKTYCNEKIETEIYHKLLDVVPDLMTIEESGKSKADGYMDLSLDILSRCPDRLIIALSHYYRHPSGDLIPDPDMEIAVFPQKELAEAMTYQDSFGFWAVANYEGEAQRKCLRDLNLFLSQWLTNLIVQGHHVQQKTAATSY